MPKTRSKTAPRRLEPRTATHSDFGNWLRRQREARGVALKEIAAQSKVGMRYLEALEQNRFDVLPAPVFARGFLRDYARCVGLNADEVINLYLLALEEQRPDEMEEPERPRPGSRAPSPWGYGLLLAAAVGAFVGIAALLSFYSERRHAAAPAAPSSAVAPPGAARAPGVAPSSPPPPPLSDGTRIPDRTVAGSAVPHGVAEAAPASTPQAPLRVTLDFQEDSWVESVIDGKRHASELRAAGESLRLEAEQSVVLTLGNAPAVRVEVNGRPYALPKGSPRVVRDLRIDRPAAGAPAAPPIP